MPNAELLELLAKSSVAGACFAVSARRFGLHGVWTTTILLCALGVVLDYLEHSNALGPSLMSEVPLSMSIAVTVGSLVLTALVVGRSFNRVTSSVLLSLIGFGAFIGATLVLTIVFYVLLVEVDMRMK